MTPENIVGVVFIGILVLAFVGVALKERVQQKHVFLNKLRREWGNAPSGEWTVEELESISHYTRRREKGRFKVDDITWNDLDLDSVFLQMNSTVSSCGEDYLYSLMRLPEFDPEILKERDRLMEFFRSHKQEREKVQLMLRLIGKRKGYSVSDYLEAMGTAPVRSVVRYVIQAVLAGAAIILFFFSPLAAVAALVLMLCVNGITHYQESQKIEPYLSCLSCILRLLKAAELMGNCKIPEISRYSEKIREASGPLQKIRRKCVMLVSAKGADLGAAAIFAYLNSYFLLDFIQFYRVARLLEDQMGRVETLLEQFGILDASIAVASFREYLPLWCRPEFVSPEEKVRIQAEDLYHPLITEAVANSIQADGGILLTGSNASGKSTFLKTVALNAILAQSIYTCMASSYQGTLVKTMTSMALRDDLQGGESYFIVEIKSLKRILAEAEKGQPLLCIIDEVLRGTNTIERIAASSRILASLRKENVLAFAATHDVELTYILEKLYHNYHFEEEIRDNQIFFNYQLQRGRAASRNAISLLEIIGYDPKIVAEARKAAEDFEQQGVWKPLC